MLDRENLLIWVHKQILHLILQHRELERAPTVCSISWLKHEPKGGHNEQVRNIGPGLDHM